MVGVAVKSTCPPVQIEVVDAVIFTDATGLAVTLIFIWLEVAGDPVTQGALDVRIQITESPLAKVVVV